MSRPVRFAAIVASLVLGAGVAHAQFTPTVPIPRRRPVVDPNAAGAGRAASTRDTTPRVRLSDLKAWVDSVTQYAPSTLPAPGASAPAGPPPPPPAGPAPRRAAPAGAPPAAPARPPAATPR